MATSLAKSIGGSVKMCKRPKKTGDIFNAVKSATEDFRASLYCTPSDRVDLIIAGFIEEEPVLIYTGYDQGLPYTTLCGDFAVVGSGSDIVRVMLNLRQYAPTCSERELIYIAYEAKKYSENAPSVGLGTWMTVMFPFPEAKVSGELKMSPLGKPQLAELEKARKRLGLKLISPGVVPDLRHSTDAPSGQPPLPE